MYLLYVLIWSAVPCQICMRGHGPLYPGYYDRTISPNCFGLAWRDWQHPAGRPKKEAHPANTSGYVLAIKFAIWARDDDPIAKTFF